MDGEIVSRVWSPDEESEPSTPIPVFSFSQDQTSEHEIHCFSHNLNRVMGSSLQPYEIKAGVTGILSPVSGTPQEKCYFCPHLSEEGKGPGRLHLAPLTRQGEARPRLTSPGNNFTCTRAGTFSRQSCGHLVFSAETLGAPPG